MGTQATVAGPWQELEEQAYHAYREWPLWLVLRERELGGRVPEPGRDAASAGAAGAHAGQPAGNQALD